MWVPLTDPGATVERSAVEGLLNDVLRDADETHIVGLAGIANHIERSGFELPGCLQGLEPCASPLQSIVATFDASLLIYVMAMGDGSTLEVTVVDGALERSTVVTIEGTDLRDAVYTTVADLIGSTADLYVVSAPNDSAVYLDGTHVGNTPYYTVLTIGAYDVRVAYDGYFDHERELEMRAGDEVRIDANLVQRFATVQISTGTPGAQVFIDDALEPQRIGNAIAVDPGVRVVTVRAPGFAQQRFELDLLPGEAFSESVVLDLSREEFQRRRREDVLSHPLLLELGAQVGVLSSDFAGAELAAGVVECRRNDDGDCGGTATFARFGLQAGALINGGHLELRVLGLDYRSVRPPDGTTLNIVDENDRAVLADGTQFTLRFVQPGVRHLFGRYVEPYLHTGPALAWMSFPVVVEPGDDPDTLNRSSLLWELDLGVRVHVNSLTYGFLDVRAAADVLGNGLGGGFDVTLGVGLNLQDPTGLSDTMSGWFEPSDEPPTQPPPAAPSEL